MADQAITALPKKTYSGSSQIAATDYLLGIDSAEGYQMLIQDLGEYIINRATASLAGSTQTLASAISALNSKLNTMAVIVNNEDGTEASGTTRTYDLARGAIYLIVVGKLTTKQNTSGVYIAVSHNIASSLIPLNEAGADIAVVSIDKLVLSVEYKTTYTRTTIIRLG